MMTYNSALGVVPMHWRTTTVLHVHFCVHFCGLHFCGLHLMGMYVCMCMVPFESADRAERPAATTASLVLDGRHRALRLPVDTRA